MLMISVFVILLITVLSTWKGHRKLSFGLFGLSLLAGIIFFIQHISVTLKLDL